MGKKLLDDLNSSDDAATKMKQRVDNGEDAIDINKTVTKGEEDLIFSDKELDQARQDFIASGKAKNYPNLTVEEGTAIYYYTGGAYRKINTALRSGNASPFFIAYEKLLNQALSKLESFTGVTYRGSGPINGWDEMLKSGVFDDLGFLSSSQNPSVAMDFGATFSFTIFGKNGRDISKLSQLPEEEILFASKSKFDIISANQDNLGRWTVVLREK